MEHKILNINKILLFGGGRLLSLFIDIVIEKGFFCKIITSKRHADEIIFENMSLKSYLDEKRIEYIITDNLDRKDVLCEINNMTLGISFGSAWIFKKEFINLFNGNLINMHCSRLPSDRGGGGLSWRIMRNERRGINLLHLIDEGIDTGDIILYEEYIYPNSCRRPIEYIDFSIKNNILFLDCFLEKILKNEVFNKMQQVEYFSTYYPRLATDIHGFIDWNWRAKDIESFICAFDKPYSGSSTFLYDKKVRLYNCYLLNDEMWFHPFQWGIIYRISNNGIFVAANDGALFIEEICNDSGELINEYLKPGDRLFTPTKYLDDAKKFKAIYSPSGLKNK